MMTERLRTDLKEAMRSGDVFRRDTLRFLVSSLKNAALEKRVSLESMGDDLFLAVLRRSVKQREEGAAQYRAGNRADLAEKEDRERAILQEFLPAAPDERAVRESVERAIRELGATSLKESGRVIGAVVKSLPGVSGTEVRRVISDYLS